ncbi:MAG: sulfotransferase [Pseudomonadota bacterium]|nr:sulfotransferase [Pseudomonadota bacterium]
MKFPFDPGFPGRHEDDAYLDRLDDIEIRPVFIMGLHRSGTTFLYDSVSKCFPVANLTLYHIFYYDRLLKNAIEGGEESDRATLNRLFRALGITDRKLDSVYVEDTTVEEYGWMLRNRSYQISVSENNKDYFTQICKKLAFLHPEAQAILLKNPWDTGKAKQILEWFPNARFIYITRDPIFILNSQINAALALMTGPQPFQTMLIDDFKVPGDRITKNAIYALWKLVRGIKKVTGDGLYAFILRQICSWTVQKELEGYYRAIEELPAENVFAIDYQNFNEAPKQHLAELQAFLDLPFVTPPDAIIPKPRKGHLNDTLRSYEDRFMKRLSKKIKHFGARAS